MTKRDAMDYSLEDVDLYVARVHGITLDQIMRLDFPPPDYQGAGGAAFWTFDTVVGWLEAFHTALHAMNRAGDPEGFERMVGMLRELMSKGGDQCSP